MPEDVPQEEVPDQVERRRSWPGSDPLLTEQALHRPPSTWSAASRVGNGLAWLGGADWREIGDRSERATYQVAGFFVLLNALIAAAMMTFAAVGAADVHPLVALPVTLLWGLFVGAFDRAISAKIVDPDTSAWRSRGGFLVRGLFTVVLGVMVAEAAALTIFASSIERTLADNIQRQITDSQTLVTGADGTPSSRRQQLTDLENQRLGLDTAVADAQRVLNEKTTLAQCERSPGPQCPPDAVVTGVPGDGPEADARETERVTAIAELETARSRRTAEAPGLDQRIADLRVELDRDRAHAADLARAEAGVDARWRAMHDYTVSSGAALALRIGLAVGLIFLDLVPLLLKMLRGRSTHDERVLAARQRSSRALAEHTGRFVARLKHESTEHQEALTELARSEEIRRNARLQQLQEQVTVDVSIESARQQRRHDEEVAAIRTGPWPQPDPAVPSGAADVDRPGPADEIPDWWNDQDRKLIGLRFGPYEAIAPLSGADRGGFGRLLVGRHHADHSDVVVIKAVAEPADQGGPRRGALRLPRSNAVRRMWEAEIKAAQRLQSHAAVAEVLDYGSAHDYLWIASRLYAPGSLVRWVRALDRKQALTLEDTFTVMKQVVEALRYAHSKDLTHGDIKPHNVVLHGIRVRLVDWGLARVIGAARADVSGIRPHGTRYYTAPEALLSGPGVQFADLYSIGATWYFLLTGMAPAEDVVEDWESRPSTLEVARLLRDGALAPTPLDLLLPYVPAEVTQLVHRLLSPIPEDRVVHATRTAAASELAEEIIELERRLTPSQKRLPVGEHAVEHIADQGLARRRAIEAGPNRDLAPTEPEVPAAASDADDRPGNVVSLPERRRPDSEEEDGAGGTTQAEPEQP